jgi:hypothetical protein
MGGSGDFLVDSDAEEWLRSPVTWTRGWGVTWQSNLIRRRAVVGPCRLLYGAVADGFLPKQGRGKMGKKWGVRLGAHYGKGEAIRAWHTWQWRGGSDSMRWRQRLSGGINRGIGWRVWADQGRREMDRAHDTVESLIYSNNFQMSSNCFDQKVDLPSSKKFK